MDSGWDPAYAGGCPIRKPRDQRALASPPGLSQRATSFIASWRQGIHQMPLTLRLIAKLVIRRDKPRGLFPSRVKTLRTSDDGGRRTDDRRHRTAGTSHAVRYSPGSRPMTSVFRHPSSVILPDTPSSLVKEPGAWTNATRKTCFSRSLWSHVPGA